MADGMEFDLKQIGKQARHYKYILLVMRHARAKSSDADGDERRELTGKGEKQAKKVARGLAHMHIIPDRIACSSATRAERTLEKMLKTFGDHPTIDYRQDLYEQGTAAVFDELSMTRRKVHTLMVLGHEPAMSLASQWIANPADSRYGVLNLGLSPASMVILGSDRPFAEWSEHTADIIAVIGPEHMD